MNIQKFIAATSRQALKEIRDSLGDEAVILSNRKVEGGVEILAMAPEAYAQVAPKAEVPAKRVANPGLMAIAKPLQQTPAKVAEPAQPAPAIAQAAPEKQDASPKQDALMSEIKSMHAMLQQQLSMLSWQGVQQRDPQRAGLLRRMLSSGFSANLARQLIEKMPENTRNGEAWIQNVLKRNLSVAGEADDIVARGGVYALVGPTGVGKTTTTAKLAARAVVRFGADKVALLTTDSYRIGAYEQLKIYGKILGVTVHAVKDADDLRLTLSALKHKHLVLIDTVGMGQRDARVGDQNAMFDAAGVHRLLLLNATSSGETLEDVARKYHSKKNIGCIATKLDEAASLGSVLDVILRHRLRLHFVANGQRVPEDLYEANAEYLLHRALRPAEEKTPFTLLDSEMPAMMPMLEAEVAHACA